MQPPGMPPSPPPYGYGGYYGPPGPPGPPPYVPGQAPTESKATVSLVLGILSVMCFGILTGIPAIVLGVMSRKQIASSGGALGGAGLALGGIITGGIGVFTSAVTFVVLMVGLLAGAHAPPRSHAVSTPSAHAGPATATASELTIVDLQASRGPLDAQLAAESQRAASAKQTLVVQTTATWCQPCKEIAASMKDDEMTSALEGVRLVRVDIDAFQSELKAAHLSQPSVPWFFLLDSARRPHDAISADEWDENVAENIAPVLGEFVHGTLKDRRHAAPTSL